MFSLNGSKNEGARSDFVFSSISEVSNKAVTLGKFGN